MAVMTTLNPIKKTRAPRDMSREDCPVIDRSRHYVLSSRDMPVVRTTGNLKKWGELFDLVKPIKLAKPGINVLKELRAARESRRR